MIKSFLSGRVFEPMFWWWKGLPIFARYREFERQQFTTTVEEVQQLQLSKLKVLAGYAVNCIPYYRSLDINIATIEAAPDVMAILALFPVLTKDRVKADLSLLYKDHDGTSYKNFTGGSTGIPVTFYQDRRYLIDSLATTLLMYDWAGRSPGEKSIKLWGAERDLIDGTLGTKHKMADWIANRITLNSFAMDEKRQLHYVERINKSRPVLIEGYADSLYDLSRFIGNSGVAIHSPRSIVSSAGTLHSHMREHIELLFGCKVFDRYGSREAGNMASECQAHNGLHVFSETTIIEVVAENGEACQEGEEGDILVTNLSNFTMPLIRYDIGDRAVVGTKNCGCGRPSPLLARISGRSSCSFRLANGGVASPNFFIHTLGVICNDGSIERFQVVQKGVSYLQIKLVFYKGTSMAHWAHKNKANDLILKVMGDDCILDFSAVADIPLTATGKHLYTICEIPGDK